jgi:predicted MFS family arabinose efflux permease
MFVHVGHSALWSFQERMALSVGAPKSWIGALLAVSVLGGVLGAVLAFLLGEKLGVTRPQIIGYVLLAISACTLTGHFGAPGFAAGAVFLKVGWFFGLPYLQGSISTLDPSGRWASTAGGLQSFGTAVGPALAGLVAQHGYDSIVALAVSAYFLSAILVFAAGRPHKPAKL